MENITDTRVENFLKAHLKPYEGLLSIMEEYAKEHCVPIVQSEVARFICILAKMQKPCKILEIGTAIGYSATLLSAAVPTAYITTIERDKEIIAIAKENFIKGGNTHRITLLEGDATNILPTINVENIEEEKFDYIFLDAAKGHYSRFLPDCIRLLKHGAILVTDNALFRGMVAHDEEKIPKGKRTMLRRLKEFHEFLKDCDELESSVIPIGDGVALSYRK